MCKYCENPAKKIGNTYYYPLHETNEYDISIISYNLTKKKFRFGDAEIGAPDNTIEFCPFCGTKLMFHLDKS